MKNVTLREEKSLKVHVPNVAIPGTNIVTDQVIQLINEYANRHSGYPEVYSVTTRLTDSY